MDPSWQLLCLTAYPVSDTLITPSPQLTLSSYLSDFSCFAGCLLPYQLDLHLMSTPGEFIPVCSWSVLCAQHCSRHWNTAGNNTGPDLCPLSPCSFGTCSQSPQLLCRHRCHLNAPPPGLPSHPSGLSRDLSFYHSLVPLLTGLSPPQMASSVLKTEPARLYLALDCLAQAGPSSPSPLLARCRCHLSFRCLSLPPRWLYFMGYLPIQPKPTAASCPSCAAPLFEGRHGLPPASSFKHRVCG